jgi:hypothetical protein
MSRCVVRVLELAVATVSSLLTTLTFRFCLRNEQAGETIAVVERQGQFAVMSEGRRVHEKHSTATHPEGNLRREW